ncbi:MAG: glucokinase [Methyloceanibacter sp.]
MSKTNIPDHALVADIGGTNARFAVADLDTLELAAIRDFPCASHPTPAAAMCHYLADLAVRPRHAAIAVAAPVTSEEIEFTNSPWSFTRSELCRAAELHTIHVLNDFEALSLSLPHLLQAEVHQIGGDAPVEDAAKAVLGPGTGLGVAGLVWSGAQWVAVPGQGGHVSLRANDERELALLERLRFGRDHLSFERALSGPGLSDLYRAVAASHGRDEERLAPNDVLSRALQGDDDLAEETVNTFTAWLGSFAGDIALVFGARGGVYLGGGISPRLLSRLAGGAFRRAFEDKGRMKSFLAPIPVYVILAEFAALKGAASSLRVALPGRPPSTP